MKAFVLDTETTGIPLWKEPSEHPGQPHIVQLAALLVDMDTYKVISSLDLIVKPEGWEIPPDMAALHGISTEMAMDVGLPEEEVVGVATDLWARADFRLAYNEPFDSRIVRIGLKRYEAIGLDPDVWKDAPRECAMRMASPIMKIGKMPKLTEACEYFTGDPLIGAHGAMADARACLEVYRAVKARETGAA